MNRTFDSYQDFFPFYVAAHSKPATRWVHFAGTHLGIALGIAGAVTRRPVLMAAAPVVTYGMAWTSHWTIEGNNPASFGHPLWSLRGDFRMLRMMWQGRDRELGEMALDYKQGELTLRVA